MAGRLNWIADVTTPASEAPIVHVQIIVRNNVATISRTGGGLVEEKAGVTAVLAVQSRTRQITFDDGTSWLAALPAKRGGCGCG